jgi:hypothetical protein
MTQSEIESQLADLHHTRGMLALHCKPTTNIDAEIATLERMRSTMDDAQAAQIRVDRETADRAYGDNVNTLGRMKLDAQAASTKALAEAEQHMRKFVDAMRQHLMHAKTVRGTQSKLNTATGIKESVPSEIETHRQASLLVASQLKTITGGYRFGILELPSTTSAPDKSWT